MSNKAAPPPVANNQGVAITRDSLVEAIQENDLGSIREVATHFGISATKAYKLLLKFNVKPKANTENDPTPEEIAERAAEIRKKLVAR